jgi:hypothetical protein
MLVLAMEFSKGTPPDRGPRRPEANGVVMGDDC